MTSTYTSKHTSSMGWDWYHRFSIWRQTGDRLTWMDWMQETVCSQSSGKTLKRTNHSKACHLNLFSFPLYTSCHGHKKYTCCTTMKVKNLYVMFFWELCGASTAQHTCT